MARNGVIGAQPPRHFQIYGRTQSACFPMSQNSMTLLGGGGGQDRAFDNFCCGFAPVFRN